MASQRQDTDLAAVAARAEKAKTERDDNFITGGFAQSDFTATLAGCIEFHPDLPEFECQRIVTRVTHDSAIPRPITAKGLLAECSRLEREYLVRPVAALRLLTEISIWWTIEIPRVVIDNVTVPDGHFKFLHPWPGQIPPGQDGEECLSVG
jgi:hypothetical protein